MIAVGLQIDIIPVTSFVSLEQEWLALQQAADAGFFQSWSWIGCLAEERYPDPVLLRATRRGRTVGLALFNRRRGGLHLSESGVPALDAPFIEHNAPLVARGETEAAPALLRAAWGVPGARRLWLSGVPAALATAAGGVPRRWQARPVPWLDLASLRGAGGDYLASRSANTRQQIRRSDRLYAAQGPLALQRAETPAQALAFLAGLVTLHEATWAARGKPGAFSSDFLIRFHQALVLRALAQEQLDLLRVTAGEAVVGYLYNFHHAGRVLAYQSGFAAAAAPQAKPGLTCHTLAIGAALQDGLASYDFLAGDHRYKRSLADGEASLCWAELWASGSATGICLRVCRKIFMRA